MIERKFLPLGMGVINSSVLEFSDKNCTYTIITEILKQIEI